MRRSNRPTVPLVNPAEKMAEIVAPAQNDITARDTLSYGVRSRTRTEPMPIGW